MENNEIKLDTETISFGQVLKTARLENKLTIDDIVAETCISKQVIEQIEAKESGKLPEPVFLRGFIKAYSEIVGLDPAEMIRMYQLEHGIEQKPVYETIDRSVARDASFAKNPLILLLIIIAGVALAFIGLVLLNFDKTSDQSGALLSGEVIENGQTDIAAQGKQKTPADFRLEVICVEETTLKISADGEKVADYTLKPEAHLELKAKEQFNILIDNNCGVTLFLNDKPIEIPGKCGQTVNVHLPQK